MTRIADRARNRPTGGTAHAGLFLLTLFVHLALPAKAAAQPLPAVPAFGDDPVHVLQVPGDFETVRRAIAEVEGSSPYHYYVVVTDSTGTGAWATRDYTDRVFETWQGQARFDSTRSVLIVASPANRQVSMRVGSALQVGRGLSPDRVYKELVEPHFIPYAEAGDYAVGLVSLIRQTENWLQSRARADALSATTVPAAEARTSSHPQEKATSTSVPVVAAAGLTLALLVLLYRRQRAQRRNMDQEVRIPFREFSDGVVQMLDEMESLAKRHNLLPYSDPDFSEPMTGATLETYTSIESTLGEVRTRWLALMEVRQRIEEELSKSRRLDDETAGRITNMLSSREQLDASVSELEECSHALAQLEAAHAEAEALHVDVSESMEDIERKLETLRAEGLSLLPYEPELESIRAALRQEEGMLVADPLGARRAFQALQERAASCQEWIERVLYHHEGAEEMWAKLHEIADLTIAKRTEGYRLVEEEGNPDPLLRQARVEHEAVRMALDRGEDEKADTYLEQAFACVEKAKQAIERQVEAAAFCLRTIPDLGARAERLTTSLHVARAGHEELEREHHPGSWSDVRRHVERVPQVLSACAPLMEQAEDDADERRQHYFRAEDILVHVEQQVNHGEQLVEAVRERVAELRALREACRTKRQEMDRVADDTRSFLRDQSRVISAETTALLEAADSLWARTRAGFDAEQPHWPAIEDQVRHVLDGFAACKTQAEEEVKAHEEVLSLFTQVQQKEDHVDDVLRRHHEDRPRSNRLFLEAHQKLQELEKDLRMPRADWVEVFSMLTAISDNLDRAAQWAVEDISLAKQVTRAIGEAEDALLKVQGYSRTGSSRSLCNAEAQLTAARRLLVEQFYERALQQALLAAQEAVHAEQVARRETRRRQALMNQRRMQQAGEILFQAARAYGGVRQRRLSAPARPRSRALHGRPTFPSRTWKSGSATSSASWGSNTGQASW